MGFDEFNIFVVVLMTSTSLSPGLACLFFYGVQARPGGSNLGDPGVGVRVDGMGFEGWGATPRL